jgi:hypothetical protein
LLCGVGVAVGRLGITACTAGSELCRTKTTSPATAATPQIDAVSFARYRCRRGR